MRAVVLREFGPAENLKLEEVPTPQPGTGEVLLRVGAVSVDLFQMEFRSGRALQIPLPRIIGNGPAGTVEKLGPDVTAPAIGTRVVVANNLSCGTCKYCRMGRETLCVGLQDHRSGMIGAHRDGGYAEYVAVPARNCIVLSDSISFEHACLIPNTIGPVVKACSVRAEVRPGENVLIVGAGGGMGLHAIQAARACGGRVIAAIRSARSEPACRDAGADEIVSTRDEDWAAKVRALTDGFGADAAIDLVATGGTLKTALTALAPAGRLVIMGYFPRGAILETPAWTFVEERTVTGNRSAGRQDVASTVALIRAGYIKPIVSRVFPLKDAVLAHKAFEAGEITGRAVLVP